MGLGGFLAGVLCTIGFYRHRPRRAGIFGGWRCDNCKRAAASLDELEGPGQGFVSAGVRPVFSRHGAGGHAEVSMTTEIE
jgi:hypothetical protein